MTYLPDVNVWIAFAVKEHAHHQIAKRWFEEVEDRLAFCRVTEMGLFRLLSNERVMAGSALTAAQSWEIREHFQTDPRVSFVREPSGFDERWRLTARAGKVGPNYWTDAYLVSLCAAAHCTLVTFDRALSRNSGCHVQLLGI